ncbi:hypothetical protein AC1031_012554 [Aphanomyces cochlioides]|nr:hypothetical protein AC1031_012554 [Aphanomyces cochlioides]
MTMRQIEQVSSFHHRQTESSELVTLSYQTMKQHQSRHDCLGETLNQFTASTPQDIDPMVFPQRESISGRFESMRLYEENNEVQLLQLFVVGRLQPTFSPDYPAHFRELADNCLQFAINALALVKASDKCIRECQNE